MSQALSDPQVLTAGWRALAGSIDHTLLRMDASREEITRLCEEAVHFSFAAVVVNPWWTSLAASLLRGTSVKTATVAGFPLGASHTTVKRYEAQEAVRVGAQELEMVMNVGALKSGDRHVVLSDIASVAEIAHQAGAILKVVIEAPVLTLEEKILSCELCLSAEADFIKTATGFSGGTAPDDVALIRGVVGERAQIKASGGIRTAAAASEMLHAGATRIGTGSALAIVSELGAPEYSSR